MSQQGVLSGCPSKVSYQGVPAKYPRELFQQGVPSGCPSKVSHQGVPARCPIKVPQQGVPSRYPSKVSYQGVPVRCRRELSCNVSIRVSQQGVLSGCPSKVSQGSDPKCVSGRCPVLPVWLTCGQLLCRQLLYEDTSGYVATDEIVPSVVPSPGCSNQVVRPARVRVASTYSLRTAGCSRNSRQMELSQNSAYMQSVLSRLDSLSERALSVEWTVIYAPLGCFADVDSAYFMLFCGVSSYRFKQLLDIHWTFKNTNFIF